MKRILSMSALCAAMFCLVLTGCNKDKFFTVTFDTQGGSDVAAITNVANGSIIVPPAVIPTKADYVFAGWYKEPACQNLWNFATDVVKSNITLYAKWVSLEDTKFTVTFDSQGGSAVADITNVAFGATITAPPAPTKDDFIFSGWYKEPACENVWTFATDIVISDITLYAKWTADDSFQYADLLGNYNVNGTPDFAVNPGMPSWTCEILSGVVNEYYDVSDWCGLEGLSIWIDIMGGKAGILEQTMGELQSGYEGYLCAWYDDGEYLTPIEFYPAKWNATAKKLDFSGKVAGSDVLIGILAFSTSTGQLAGVFGDCYYDLVFTMTSPSSVSGKAHFGKKANANGITPFEGARSLKNFNIDKLKVVRK